MRALGELGYRRLEIWEQPLIDAPVEHPLGLVVSELEEDELEEYERFRPGDAAVARGRLRDGHRCSIRRLDGRIVFCSWFAAGSVHIEYLGVDLPLADDELYFYDAYTHPAERGRGVATAGLLFPRLAREGYRAAVVTCLAENRPALCSILKGGYEHTGTIGVVRLGPWRRPFLRRRPVQAARHSSRSTA